MSNPVVSVIIVHYNTPALLHNCVQSLIKGNDASFYEIIIVDNSAPNNFQAEFSDYPNLKWIQLDYNAGFSRGNNTGIKKALGEYVLILNPDTEVPYSFLKNLLTTYTKLTDIKLGILTCRIESFNDKGLQVGSFSHFPSIKQYWKANPLNIIWSKFFPNTKQVYNPKIEHYKLHEVLVATGACTFIKKQIIFDSDLFYDEDYFLYSEDVDLSKRFVGKGFKNYFDGDLVIYHVNSASSPDSKKKSQQVWASKLLYFYKNESKFKFTLLRLILWNNFTFDLILAVTKQNKSSINRIKRRRKFELHVLKRIKSEFKREPSSSKEYFKIDYESE